MHAHQEATRRHTDPGLEQHASWAARLVRLCERGNSVHGAHSSHGIQNSIAGSSIQDEHLPRTVPII